MKRKDCESEEFNGGSDQAPTTLEQLNKHLGKLSTNVNYHIWYTWCPIQASSPSQRLAALVAVNIFQGQTFTIMSGSEGAEKLEINNSLYIHCHLAL
jgi:hypothetical protein